MALFIANKIIVGSKRAAFLLGLLLLSHIAFSQVIQSGVANLVNVDFSKEEPIALDGDWNYYSGKFLTHREVTEYTDKPSLIYVPSGWTSTTLDGKPLDGYGYGTYWLKVQLQESPKNLALKMRGASSAYKVFIDDKLYLESGQIGISEATSIPRLRMDIIPLNTDKKEFTLRIQVSNFHYRTGGLWEHVVIGDEIKIRHQKYKDGLLAFFIIGIAIAFALYHLGIYLLMPKSHTALLFAFFCFAIALRVFSAGNMIILDFFPELSWEWRTRSEIISFFLIITLGLQFSSKVFPKEFSNWFFKILIGLCWGFTVFCLFTSPKWHSHAVRPFEILTLVGMVAMLFGIIKAIVSKREGAVAYLFGYLFIMATGIIELLHTAYIIPVINAFNFGIVALLTAKAYVLSKQFVNAFGRAELLGNKLKDANHNLELKVQERTQDLHTTNDSLVASEEESRQNAEELVITNSTLLATKHEVEQMLKQEQQNVEALKLAQEKLIQAEKMSSLGQMVAGVAHEINNPINFISGGVQSLRMIAQDIIEVLEQYERLTPGATETFIKEKLRSINTLKEELEFDSAPKDIIDLLSDIEVGADRAAEIVRGLSDFSRKGEDKKQLADIHRGIDSTLVLLHSKFKHRIEISKNYDESISRIMCFPNKLNQVFMNIIANAADAIEGKGTIEISTKNHEDSISISISDSGNGIPEEVQRKIFDPFFTTKPVGKGTGLGLSISYGIIEAHEGELKVESELEKGTTFIITLPKGVGESRVD
ncbi:MAG: signal transduction histidine kinase [Arenicella sp.]|jgi:signal transduction histidine kinase